MAVNIEMRQLGDSVDSIVNATLEASENFTSQWRDGKTIYCSFTKDKKEALG